MTPPDMNKKRSKIRQSILVHPTKSDASLPLFDDEINISDPVIFDRVTLWGREEFQNSEVSVKELHDLRLLSEDGCRYSDPQLWMKEDSMGYTGFHRICNSPRDPKLGPSDPRWQYVRVYLIQLMIDPLRGDSELRMQQRKGHKYTPLHVVCMFNPPLDVVEDMIRLCPASLQMTTSNGDLPLGLAAGGFFSATPEVIEMLAEANPDAVLHRSKLGKTPLHHYLEACIGFNNVPNPRIMQLLIVDNVAELADNDGHTPLWKLGRAAKNFHLNEQQLEEFSSALTCILANHSCKDTSFLSDLRCLPPSLRITAFETKRVKQILNASMERAPYTAMLMMDFYVQFMIIISFTFGIVEGNRNRNAISALHLFGCAYWTLRKILSFAASKSKMIFIFDAWRLLEVAHIVMVAISATLMRNNSNTNPSAQKILISTSALIWLALISILRHASKDFAVFVGASIKIFIRLLSFILVSFIILLAFATMFYLSAFMSDPCNDDDLPYLNFCTLPKSLLKSYVLFVGSMEEGSFDVDGYDIPPQTVVLLAIFAFVVVVLLLNIIIAIVNDAYQSVNAISELVFWNHRFDYLSEVDGLIRLIGRLSRRVKISESSPNNCDDNDDNTWRLGRDCGGTETEQDLFERIITCHSITSCLDFFDLVAAVVALIFLLIAGIFLLGWPWPRSVRRLIFCPTITATPTRTAEENKELKNEIDDIRQKLASIQRMLEKEK